MRRLFLALALVLAAWAFGRAGPAHAGDCAGLPAGAVSTLPAPLDRWGQLYCTAYGQVIAPRKNWIWSRPGDYQPVLIPSQRALRDPAPLGNRSYFTRLSLAPVGMAEFMVPFLAFRKVFPKEPPPPAIYRLDVASNAGGALLLYFLDYEGGPWGIWCTGGDCDPGSVFMLIDLGRKPAG